MPAPPAACIHRPAGTTQPGVPACWVLRKCLCAHLQPQQEAPAPSARARRGDAHLAVSAAFPPAPPPLGAMGGGGGTETLASGRWDES